MSVPNCLICKNERTKICNTCSAYYGFKFELDPIKEAENDICGVGTVYASKDKLWEFVDYHVTGKPIQITSKRQWKRLLKEHNKHDDVSMNSLNIIQKNYECNLKEKIKKENHAVAVEVLRDMKQMGGNKRRITWTR